MSKPQHPAMTAAEQAMLQSYDYFLRTMEHEPVTAARLALQTLDLWSNAAQPQKKGRKKHEQSVSIQD